MKSIAPTIPNYISLQTGEKKKICTALSEVFKKVLNKQESKIWHGGPVWFDNGNPIAGFSARKVGVTLLFWSGQEFGDVGLEKEGSFRAAQKNYTEVAQINIDQVTNWLQLSITYQLDYKNIIKNKGKLYPIIL